MKIFYAALVSLVAFNAFADQQDEPKENEISAKAFVIPDKSSGKCVPTPGLNQADHYPGRSAITTNNNLALPTGKAVYAQGQRVHISGRVLDKNCVPVSDAIIDIWQTDMQGRYVASTANERANPYPHFTGAGRAVTDNTGHFTFTTIFPGVEYTANPPEMTKGKKSLPPKRKFSKAPAINFRITHLNFNAFNTKVYFDHDARNHDDALFSSLSPWWQNQVVAEVSSDGNAEGSLSFSKDFILSGKNAYRKY